MAYRREEYEKLHNEMRCEHDQEINRRILNDIIQNRGGPGLSYASAPMSHPNDDREHQEVCKSSFFGDGKVEGQR